MLKIEKGYQQKLEDNFQNVKKGNKTLANSK